MSRVAGSEEARLGYRVRARGAVRCSTRTTEEAALHAEIPVPRIAGTSAWRPPMGATLTPEGVRFQVWAPDARSVAVEIEGEPGRPVPMEAGGDGTWVVLLPGGR